MTQPTELFLQLFQKMVKYFNLNELKTLSFTLDVDWEMLPGDDKPTKVISFITFLIRRQQLSKLLVQLGKERPAVQWPDINPSTFSDFDVTSFLNRKSQKSEARNVFRASNDGTIKIGGAVTQEGDVNIFEADTGGNIEAGQIDQKNRKM